MTRTCQKHKKARAGQTAPLSSRVLLSGAFMLVAAAPLPAQACPAMLMGYASASAGSITAYISSMSLAFSTGFIRFSDAITRLANQESNNEQEHNKANSARNDKVNADQTATAVGAARAELAPQFIPSKVVCGIASTQLRVASTTPNYTAVRRSMAQSNTARSLNGPGSGAERGSLQAMNTIFQGRCTRYMNTTTVTIPTGLTCPGPADANFKDLDIQPWRSILQPLNLDTPELKQAAADTLIMLTEPAPPDPIRGPVLSRQEGQNAAVMRLRDVTRMNVARAALEDIVAMRTTAALCATGDNSRLARYVELITGERVTGNTVGGQMSAIAAAGEPENANVQAVAARLASQKMMLMELLRLTDHWVTMEAVSLAIKTEQGRNSGAGVSARAISN